MAKLELLILPEIVLIKVVVHVQGIAQLHVLPVVLLADINWFTSQGGHTVIHKVSGAK